LDKFDVDFGDGSVQRLSETAPSSGLRTKANRLSA
jgi:hypothetical protein